MDGNWRIIIEGNGGFCRNGDQLEYDADYLAREMVVTLKVQKQNVTRASFDTVPNTDAFSRDLLNG